MSADTATLVIIGAAYLVLSRVFFLGGNIPFAWILIALAVFCFALPGVRHWRKQ